MFSRKQPQSLSACFPATSPFLCPLRGLSLACSGWRELPLAGRAGEAGSDQPGAENLCSVDGGRVGSGTSWRIPANPSPIPLCGRCVWLLLPSSSSTQLRGGEPGLIAVPETFLPPRGIPTSQNHRKSKSSSTKRVRRSFDPKTLGKPLLALYLGS